MFHSSLAPWKVTKERPRFRFFLEKIIFIAAYSVCIISAKEGDISPNCYDVPGWVDSIGDGCESYGYAILDDYYRTDENVDWCVLVGASYENDGDTAQSACCICGGGIRIESDVPTSFPSVSTEPSYTARPTACYDIPGWVDPHEDGCKWYSEGKEGVRCQTAGTVLKMDGLTASDACCVCGGGTESADAPTPSPTVNNDPCFDDHTWTDALGFGCDWYKNMQAKAVAKGACAWHSFLCCTCSFYLLTAFVAYMWPTFIDDSIPACVTFCLQGEVNASIKLVVRRVMKVRIVLHCLLIQNLENTCENEVNLQC